MELSDHNPFVLPAVSGDSALAAQARKGAMDHIQVGAILTSLMWKLIVSSSHAPGRGALQALNGPGGTVSALRLAGPGSCSCSSCYGAGNYDPSPSLHDSDSEESLARAARVRVKSVSRHVTE